MNGDNKFGHCCGCPATMDDGRIFTNWMPNVRFNEYIKHANNIVDNHQYRLWLQRNACQIMGNEKQHLEATKRCHFNYSKNVDYSDNRLQPPHWGCSDLTLNSGDFRNCR